jgi:hypothetical protein
MSFRLRRKLAADECTCVAETNALRVRNPVEFVGVRNEDCSGSAETLPERRIAVHIRPSQLNPNIQLDAMYAAEKAAAKREAERTRKKLMESASKLAGESESGEASIVEIGAREESREESSRQERQDTADSQKPKDEADSQDAERYLSDWA